MSAPPFEVKTSDKVDAWLKKASMSPSLERKLKKFKKAIKFLRDIGPAHPGLETHQMKTWTGPNGEPVWNSYIENDTPSAWRMYWIYDGADTIQILSVGPHDHTP